MTTYATTDELSRRLSADGKAVTVNLDVELSEAVESASRFVDAHCGRVFYKDTTATARVYWPRWDYDLGGYVVDLDPDVWSITSVKHDSADDGTYETTWTNPANYLTLPRNSTREGVTGMPVEALLVRADTYLRLSGDIEPVEVTGKAGWSAVPGPVKQATLIVAADLLKLREAPFGVAGFGEFGQIRVKDNPRAAALLKPYVKAGTSLPGIA